RPRKAESRAEVVGLGVVHIAIGGPGKQQAAGGTELPRWNFRDRVPVVSGNGGAADGVGCGEVEAIHRPVEAFSGGQVALISNTKVQRESRLNAEIVLEKQRVIAGLIRAGGCHVEAAAGRQAQEKGGEILPQRRGGRVVERTARPIGAETVGAARELKIVGA